jgi:hypothetical protein
MKAMAKVTYSGFYLVINFILFLNLYTGDSFLSLSHHPAWGMGPHSHTVYPPFKNTFASNKKLAKCGEITFSL